MRLFRRLPADPLERATVLMHRMLVSLGLLVVAVFVLGYFGRLEDVETSRAACEQRKLDQSPNGLAWAAASIARRSDERMIDRDDLAEVLGVLAGEVPGFGAEQRMPVSELYGGAARRLIVRSRQDCRETFPAPSLIPLP